MGAHRVCAVEGGFEVLSQFHWMFCCALLVDTRAELFELAVRVGLGVFTAMLEEAEPRISTADGTSPSVDLAGVGEPTGLRLA